VTPAASKAKTVSPMDPMYTTPFTIAGVDTTSPPRSIVDHNG
jgi:hypothetical protein